MNITETLADLTPAEPFAAGLNEGSAARESFLVRPFHHRRASLAPQEAGVSRGWA